MNPPQWMFFPKLGLRIRRPNCLNNLLSIVIISTGNEWYRLCCCGLAWCPYGGFVLDFDIGDGHKILDYFANLSKAGWFEISFSNQVDFKRVWDARPFHVFSQLLLLKNWHPGFDPSKESISSLDLWVRLHFLPEEYANAEELSVIMESNFAGSFIKLDPAHNSNRMNMFTRFCINTDVAINVGRKIIIPDEECNQVKYKLWFDDFPDGCGACGLPDHIFDDSPNRAIPIPTLQVTIKKSNSTQHANSSNSQGRNVIGKNNKTIPNSKGSLTHQNKPYLSDKPGINIVYESEGSDEFFHRDPLPEDFVINAPKLISASDGIYWIESQKHLPVPNNTNHCVSEELNGCNNEHELVNKRFVADQGIKETLLDGNLSESLIPSDHGNDKSEEEHNASNEFDPVFDPLQQNYILNTTLPAEMILPSTSLQDLVMLNNANVNSPFPAEDAPINDYEDDYPMNMDHDDEPIGELDIGDFDEGFVQYYEEEEPFEDIDSPPPEEPTPEVMINSPSHPILNENILTPLLNGSDPPQTENDIDNFLYGYWNNSPGHLGLPEKSFHSTHNSLQSSSSMIKKIDNFCLIVLSFLGPLLLFTYP